MSDMTEFSDFMKKDPVKKKADFVSGLAPIHPDDQKIIKRLTEQMLTRSIEKAKADLAHFSDQVKEMVSVAHVHEVTDEPSMKSAVEMEIQAKRLNVAIKDKAKEILKDTEEYIKAVKNFVKPWTADLDLIVKELKTKKTAFEWRKELDRRKKQEEARKAQIELQKTIDAEAKKAGIEAPRLPDPIVPKKKTVVHTEEGTSYLRTEWKPTEVFDLRILALAAADEDIQAIPLDVIEPNMTALRNLVKMGIRQIPGVKIEEVPTSVSKM